MEKQFLTLLKKFLLQNNYHNLKEIKIDKKQIFFLKTLHIIVEGTLEVYMMSNYGTHIKIGTYTSKESIMGSLFDKYLNRYDLTIYYKSHSNLILKKVPKKALEEALLIPSINKLFFEIILKRITNIIYHFFTCNTLKSGDFIKILLKKEANTSNIVEINNVFNFVDKYNISRSTFYKGIKELIKNKEIKKEGKKITILEK